jgi:hypothetical protein
MQARLRRLHADYAQVCAAFAAHPHIRLVQTDGVPPDKYGSSLFSVGSG